MAAILHLSSHGRRVLSVMAVGQNDNLTLCRNQGVSQSQSRDYTWISIQRIIFAVVVFGGERSFFVLVVVTFVQFVIRLCFFRVCFTLSRLIIFSPDVSLIKPEDSLNPLFQVIVQSVPWVSHLNSAPPYTLPFSFALLINIKHHATPVIKRAGFLNFLNVI